MLEDFACRNGLPNPTHFTDDGVSGTRFDRPGFLAMMEEVEAGRVEAIVIKDMSRLGRDYLKVGQVMEVLRPRHQPENPLRVQVQRHERQAPDRHRYLRRQMVYLPNKSLCDPVRASVSTSTSSSIR